MNNVIPNYMTQTMLPKQQVIKVRGMNAAKNIRMREDSSIILADETEPIIYLCYTDGLGNVSVDAYDITPHKSEEQKQTDQIISALTAINERLTRLEEAQNESVVAEVITANEQSISGYSTNQENVESTQFNGKSTGGYKPNHGKQSSGTRNK